MLEDFNRGLWSRLSTNKTRNRAEVLPEVELPHYINDGLRTPSFYQNSSLHSFPISESGSSICVNGKTSLRVKVKKLGKNCVKTLRPRSVHGPDGSFDLSQSPSSWVESPGRILYRDMRYEPSHTTVESSHFPHALVTHITQGPFSDREKSMQDDLSLWETSAEVSRCESSKAKTESTGDECKALEEDQMRETIRALCSTANRITGTRKTIQFQLVPDIALIPSLPLSPDESAVLSGNTSALAHSILKKSDGAAWHDAHARNKKRLTIFIRREKLSSQEYTSSKSSDQSATFSPSDIEDGSNEHQEVDDDVSSICTLSDGEPDYFSIPFNLPTWPALPTCLNGPFAR